MFGLKPRKLMAYLGLLPSEDSTVKQPKRDYRKTGNSGLGGRRIGHIVSKDIGKLYVCKSYHERYRTSPGSAISSDSRGIGGLTNR
jgi:hypothetical protein